MRPSEQMYVRLQRDCGGYKEVCSNNSDRQRDIEYYANKNQNKRE